jgi:hypothetical protein
MCYVLHRDERTWDAVSGDVHPDELSRYQQKEAKRTKVERLQRLEEEDERKFNLQRRRMPRGRYLNGDDSLVFASFDFPYDEDTVSFDSNLSLSSDEQEAANPNVATGEPPTSIYVAHSIKAAPLEGVSTLTALTWNTVIGRILNSGHVDPAMVDIIQQRHDDMLHDDSRNSDDSDLISMRQIGLVPNFSRPLAGAPFFDRFAALETDASIAPSVSSLKPLTNGDLTQLPNGVSGTSTPSSHALPSGLTPPNELHVLLPSTTSPPLSPTTQITRHESMIALQTRLIKSLHETIDSLRERNEDLEENVIPRITQRLADTSGNLEKQQSTILRLLKELVDLKVCIDFGNRLLSGCWVRERELWCRMRKLRDKRKRNNNCMKGLFEMMEKRKARDESISLKEYESEAFGLAMNQSTPSFAEHLGQQSKERHDSSTRDQDTRVGSLVRGNAIVSRNELDALVRFAEQNLKFLKEDIAEMVRLVQNCEKHGSDDPSSVGRESFEYGQLVREV